MKNGGTLRWYLFLGALLFTAVIVLVTTPSAMGSEIPKDSYNRLPLAQSTSTADASPTPTATLVLATDVPTSTLSSAQLVTPTLTPRPTITPRPTPLGNGPDTARIPMWVKPEYCIEAMCPGALSAPLLNSPGGWEWLDGNSSVWYKMDDGHSLQVQMWILANGQQGLTLDVFAPEQKDVWNSKPIGRGAPNRGFPGTDLFYSGRTAAYGIWYARLTNTTPNAINYSFRYTRTTPSLNNVCASCHAVIGYDWDSCVDGPNSNHCQALWDYLGTNPQCFDHNPEEDLQGNCH